MYPYQPYYQYYPYQGYQQPPPQPYQPYPYDQPPMDPLPPQPMLPSNLFSPYAAAVPSMPPPQPMAPSPLMRLYLNMPVPQQPSTAPQSPYLTPLNNNNSLDQLNLSRTVVIKNIDKDVSLNELLNEIDHGPIEYCKMFERPSPKHITDTPTVKYCYILFVNSKVSICFHLKYSKNPHNLAKLKELLKNSTHLKITLNEAFSGLGSLGARTTNKQDYIKLKTLNYIMEFNATRCVLIKFIVSPALADDEDRFEAHKNAVKDTCTKYGDVEDYKVSFKQDKHELRVMVHFTSIDSAIKTYEYYLKRILVENMDDQDDEEVARDARATSVNFHKDRCDRTDLDKRSLSSISRTVATDPSFASTDVLDDEDDLSNDAEGETSEEAEPAEPNQDARPEPDQTASVPGSPEFKSENTFSTPRSALETQLYVRNPTRNAPSNPFPFNPDPYNVGNRTIYLGNLHPSSTVEEIANNVRAGGLVESIVYRPEKRVCFITFVDPNVALKFYLNHQVLHQLIIHGYDITVGWAKSRSGPLSREISLAVTAGASRNVYIGFKNKGDPLDAVYGSSRAQNQVPLPSEEELRTDFSKFGDMEQINFYHNRDCGFLNFLNIIDAIHLVELFESRNGDKITSIVGDDGLFYARYSKFKISFAKDRCGNPPKFSYRKRSRRRERIDFHYENEETPHGGRPSRERDDNDAHHKVPNEAAMVFGITSKDSDSDKEAVDDDLPAVRGLLLGESQSEGEISPTRVATASPSKNGTYEEEEEDEEDDDDVSIIIGSDETASTTANNSNKEEAKKIYKSKSGTCFKKPYSDHMSSASFQSHGHFGRPHDPHYGKYPTPYSPQPYQQLPYYPPPQQRVGYGYMASPSSAAPPYPQYPPSRGQYMSSGSQVMAQYLAKTQHDNLLYAASVLSHEYDFDGAHEYRR